MPTTWLSPRIRFNPDGGLIAMIFTVTQILAMVSTTPTPDDWASNTPFQVTSDTTSRVTMVTAYINVTRLEGTVWKWSKQEVGRFGSGYVGPAKGELIHIASDGDPNDHTGCHLPFRSTRPDRKLPQPGVPWIALIKRGRCNFETKVDNAYRTNAVGVLVYNDRDSHNLDKMTLATDKGRNISAVFTYKWKGEELARYLENTTEVHVHITIAREESRNAINRTSVLFVSITFIVLMIISLAWLVFYYVQRFRHIHAKDKLSRRLCNAAKKALSKIPTKNIKSEDKEVQGDGECCAVCIEPYKISEVLRILPCTHEFHKSCIDPWLLEHRTCPMCKMDILKHYGFVFLGSQESILHMDIEDMGVLESMDESNSPRTGGGISPLPQIRATVVSSQQLPYDSSFDDEQSSRASTPNELTPSLSTSIRHVPVRKELCVNCIAAATAASALVSSQNNVNEELQNFDWKNVSSNTSLIETHYVQVQNKDNSPQNKFAAQ